jgi:membrane protein
MSRRAGPVLEPGDFKRAFACFQQHGMTQWAAAVTYFSMLSLFPALLVGVAVLGVFGQQGLVEDAAAYLKEAGAPRATVDAVASALESAQSERGTAAGALAFGLVTALYAASGALGSVGAALNQVLGIEERRGFVKHKLHAVGWTVVLMVLVLLTCVLVFLGGELASDLLGFLGLGDTLVAVWHVARWPAALVSAMLIYAVVYHAAPAQETRRWRWVTPGAAFGVLAWILASAAFFVYVSTFARYSATYGAFATVVILLVWLYLTNLVLVFGAELNAAVDRRRASPSPATSTSPPGPGSRRRARGAARR